MSENQEHRTKTQEFITLEVSRTGFVVYGIGPWAERCIFRGESLPSFLEKLWKKMWALKDELNQSWEELDRQNLENPANRVIIGKYLAIGSWAYALALELTPFIPDCRHGPTDPLRHLYIQRLEEIFTKCFAAAHLFGSVDEGMVGLRGLLTDFELNGGIDIKTGGQGSGFHYSINMYYLAYFAPTDRSPIVYQKFSELTETLSELIKARYPKITGSFAAAINGLLKDTYQGFGNETITSPAKVSMVTRLSQVVEKLLGESAEETSTAKAVF